MALVECPECRGQVSDAAAACPHCGHPVAKTAVEKQPASKRKKNSGCGWALLLIGVGFVFAILGAETKPTQPGISGVGGPSPPSTPTPTERCNVLVDSVIAMSKERDTLLTPSILKIYDVKMQSASGDEISCKGKAKFSRGSERWIVFGIEKDEDGDTFIYQRGS
jgi:hypothetical protein